MNFSKAQADAQLAEIDTIVLRVKQSRIYRVSGAIAMMWGALQLVQFGVQSLFPAQAGWNWMLMDALGVALTVAMIARARRGMRARPGSLALPRALAAFALFYGFGFVWSAQLGHFGARETAVFWHTLFLFGYCLAGLWFGVGFFAIGASLTALILAVYWLAGPQFWLLLALVAGFGYILCGYWMRRA